jgi:hypothetical protein
VKIEVFAIAVDTIVAELWSNTKDEGIEVENELELVARMKGGVFVPFVGKPLLPLRVWFDDGTGGEDC